jgi:hypothetical protein
MSAPLPLTSRPLFELGIEVERRLAAGARTIAHIRGGRFAGARLRGRLLPGGGDWLVRLDPETQALDVRICLETDDGALIYAAYPGRLVIPAELRAQSAAARAAADPAGTYLRALLTFETAEPRYAWLNRIVAVGVGRLTAAGVAYSVHEVT